MTSIVRNLTLLRCFTFLICLFSVSCNDFVQRKQERGQHLWTPNHEDVTITTDASAEIAKETATESRRRHPTIYTYFERIDISSRTTGMTDRDDDEILLLWKESWTAAGWNPIILTPEDIDKGSRQGRIQLESFNVNNLTMLHQKINELNLDEFGTILFRRWVAMVVMGGGWFSDYDNFPLPGRFIPPPELPNMGKLTIHDLLSPTLASGSAEEWMMVLNRVLEVSAEHCIRAKKRQRKCFWTDSLGIHILRADHQNDISLTTTKMVARPYDRNDPVYFNNTSFCESRQFQKKWTVHFGPEMLQASKYVPPTKRLPQHRMELAKNWLERWRMLCTTKQDTTNH